MRTKAMVMALLLLLAACGDDDGDASLDTPSLQEIAAVSDCTALIELVVQADDAFFWNNAELTIDEVNDGAGLTTDDSGPSFAEIDVAIRDSQTDLGCPDAEIVAALESAAGERCEEWLADGHTMDEDPLLLNTVFCAGMQGQALLSVAATRHRLVR